MKNVDKRKRRKRQMKRDRSRGEEREREREKEKEREGENPIRNKTRHLEDNLLIIKDSKGRVCVYK